MNQKQKITLFCMAAIIGAMILYPPYIVKNYRQMIIKSGYAFLFDLPPHESVSSDVTNMFHDLMPPTLIPATVNIATLFMQIIGVLIVGGLAFIALKKP